MTTQDDHIKVPVNQVQSKVFTVGLPDDVTINTSPAPLLASKYTFSPTGTVAPLAPPEVADQFVVESQYPFPPDTQYLSVAGFVDHPIFPDTYVLFTHATHVAPPVTPISWRER